MAVLQCLLSTVLPLLLSCWLWKENWPLRRLHQVESKLILLHYPLSYNIILNVSFLCTPTGYACSKWFELWILFRYYIPILKNYPNQYIYEPWNAPELVQKAANCVVGVDYPKPMINHAEGSRLNIERMKQVYQQLSHYRGLSKSTNSPVYN